jgi:hypothetical protein
MALIQAADEELTLREMFHELADGIVHRAGKLLGNLKLAPTEEHRGPGEMDSHESAVSRHRRRRNRAFLLVSASLP